MAFGKWNTSGELTWVSGDKLTASDLNDSIDEVVPPIGHVTGWLKSFSGVPATLPTGFVECNGQVLSDADSPLNGGTIPNLNNSGGGGSQRFLRGATTSGTTGGADSVTLTTTELPAHSHTTPSRNDNSGPGTANVVVESGLASNDTVATSSEGSGAAFSILNSYYQVVWIVRVK